MIKIYELTEATEYACQCINMLLKDLSSSPHSLGLAQLEQLIKNPHTHLFMAKADDTPQAVGMYTLAVTELPTGTRVWLEDVVVGHKSQGTGLGRTLVNHAIQQARTLYPSAVMMLTSRPTRLAANHIYANLFQKKETNVYKLDL